MISSPFILNLYVTHLELVLLNQNLLRPISARFKGQTDSNYFDQSQAFDKIPHTLLLHYLNNINLFQS
jgi:hypothetical protein